MAVPRVFVSSTCYDLHYIRENIKFFIKNMGFEPILSEEGSVFYNPDLNVKDSCLAEVPNCQLFVLVIGGRSGSKSTKNDESITNNEYREAVKLKIPVFAMVEQQVYAEYKVYNKNRENTKIDANFIDYPGIDSAKIFEFMAEVENNAVNNALVPFADFSGLESYLKKQWAGLMFSFLTKKSESERVTDMLETLTTMNNRIEFLSKQILSSVGQGAEGVNARKINALLFEIMSSNLDLNKVFQFFHVKPSPIDLISHENLGLLLVYLGCKLKSSPGQITLKKKDGNNELHINTILFDDLTKEYGELKEKMVNVLKENKLTVNEFEKRLKVS
jgi:hypothetical protein